MPRRRSASTECLPGKCDQSGPPHGLSGLSCSSLTPHHSPFPQDKQPRSPARDGLPPSAWSKIGSPNSATASRTKSLETNHIALIPGLLSGYPVHTPNPTLRGPVHVQLARQNSQLLHERQHVEVVPARLHLAAFKVQYPTRSRCLALPVAATVPLGPCSGPGGASLLVQLL